MILSFVRLAISADKSFVYENCDDLSPLLSPCCASNGHLVVMSRVQFSFEANDVSGS